MHFHEFEMSQVHSSRKLDFPIDIGSKIIETRVVIVIEHCLTLESMGSI